MMRRLLILGSLIFAMGCSKTSEPTTTAPSGWSPPSEVAKPTGSKVEPGK